MQPDQQTAMIVFRVPRALLRRDPSLRRWDGRWERRPYTLGLPPEAGDSGGRWSARATGRYELRDDGAAAEVYEIGPPCVVPDCDLLAPTVFTAAEAGRLAGRNWLPGDQIELCQPHADDVYRAMSTQARTDLARWLLPDAKPSLDREGCDHYGEMRTGVCNCDRGW
jgi:hypothetical protein